MNGGKIVSTRGVYYDLTKSPHEFKSPCGDIFKFSSAKKLEIYTRDVVKELKRVGDFLVRNELYNYLTNEEVEKIYRVAYIAFYRKVER